MKKSLLIICFSIATITFIITFIAVFIFSPDLQQHSQQIEEPNNVIEPTLQNIKKTNNADKISGNKSILTSSQTPQTITSEDNPQPLQTMIRPTWKLTGDIAAKLKTLKQAAQKGDARANYQLAMNYKYCFYAASNQQQLEEKLQDAYEFADSDKTIDNINHKYQYCKSVTDNQRQQYYQHLMNAAHNGEVAAQEAIGNITEHQYMKQINEENLEREAYVAKRDEFIRQQLSMLKNAANHGSIKALMKLSNMQYSQNYGPNGYLKAYAYNQVILELTKENQVYNRYSWYQQKMYDQFTPEELAQAEQISSHLLESIKQNGTFYPHVKN